MTAPVLTKRSGYAMADLQPIIEGKIVLPNIKPVEGDVGGAILHYTQMHCGNAVLPTGIKKWHARFFLDYGQGGGLQGTGIAAWTDWRDGAYRATAVKFAICEHEPVEGAGANPSRGWHPAHCAKCGLDLSVDSGD